MKKILTLVFILFLAFPAYANDAPLPINYFETLPAEELEETLEPLKIKNCEEFTDVYLNIEKTDPKLLIKSMAYETGICVQQDLQKARDLYEELQTTYNIPTNYPVRLALIYEFGPENLLDLKRARFFTKQTIIRTAIFDEEMRNKIVEAFLIGKPIPQSFKEELEWIKSVLQYPPDQKRKLAKKLKKEGFRDTEFIWNPVWDEKPREIKPITKK